MRSKPLASRLQHRAHVCVILVVVVGIVSEMEAEHEEADAPTDTRDSFGGVDPVGSVQRGAGARATERRRLFRWRLRRVRGRSRWVEG
jgi:hypothetical protein